MRCPHCETEITAKTNLCPSCSGPVAWPDDESSAPVPIPGEEDSILEIGDDTGDLESAMAGLDKKVGAAAPPERKGMKCPSCSNLIKNPTKCCPFCMTPVQWFEDAPTPAQGSAPSAASATPVVVESLEIQPVADAEVSPASGQKSFKEQAPIIGVVLLLGAGLAFQLGLFGGSDEPETTAAMPPPTTNVSTQEPEEEEVLPQPIEKMTAMEAMEAEAAQAAADLAASQREAESARKAKDAETPASEEAPEEWWFYGKVFDLLTLKSIANVEMVFIGGNEDFNVKTDAKGEFKIKVPIVEGSYEVIIERKGYGERYLIDEGSSYAKMPKAQRNKLWGRVPQRAEWTGKQAKWKRQDVVLFPE